jgi:hypothetical protein
MLNHYHVGMLPVFLIQAALAAIFFYPHHYAIPGRQDFCSPFHFEIYSRPVFMRIGTIVTLYY